MFQFVKPNVNINFVGQFKIWVWFSVLTVIASIVLFFTKGLNYGIDFTGGAEIEVQVPVGWDIGRVRKLVEEEAQLKGARVQSIGEEGARQFLIKAQGDEGSLSQVSGKVRDALQKSLKPQEYEVLRADVVGPAAGASLRTSGFLSMLYAIIAILIYVTLRFDSRYSPGLIVATFHDAVIVVGLFVLFQKPFDLTILAALLALIGYSNNDTIVTFDRVRELANLHPQLDVRSLVNKAINDTLSRTVLTSVTTLLVLTSLLFLGGKVIHDFAFALAVGVVVGTYSTIYVASAMLVGLTEYRARTSSTRARA